ncbi:hypothetical protein GCM10009853_029470 [Glycomyces scopariae]
MHDRSDSPDAYDRLLPLFGELAGLPHDDPERARCRERLFTGHLPVAEYIAQQYTTRDVAAEKLLEVASAALDRAIDRFDPAGGGDFLAFAVPAITGEVRRYSRDNAWPKRTPRSQELRAAVREAALELEPELGRPATAAELAAHLDISEAEAALGMTDPQEGSH